MNKYVAICALLTIISCGNDKGDPNKESNIMLPEPVVKVMDSATAGKHEGLALIEGADCLTCHKMDVKLVGPSYQEVANKYTEADVDKLAAKIITGGKGVWGEIPMSAHTGMNPDNAKKMVEYILTLKK